MRNTIIVTVILFLAIIAASVYYFRDVNKEHQDNIRPLKYLPENTLLITSIRNDEITDNIFKDFDLFDALLGFDNMKLLKNYKSNILRHQSVQEYVLNSEIFISFHEENQHINTLFSIPTTAKLDNSQFAELLNQLAQDYTIVKSDTLGQSILSFKDKKSDTILHTAFYEQVLFASSSKKLLSTVFDKNSKHISEQQINYFLKNTSKNSPFTVYFAHQQYSNIVSTLLRNKKGLFIDQFNSLKGQSTWNINFKQDALMLTGETEVENRDSSYIALFSNQHKTTQSLYNVFPSNTAIFMEYSLSDKTSFQEELKKLLANRNNKTTSKDSTDKESKIWSSNFALVELANQTNIGFIKLDNDSTWREIRSKYLNEESDSTFRFNKSNVLYVTFGDAFKNFTRPYLVKVDNYVVVANSSYVLENYLDDLKSKDLLIGTLGFKNFEKLQGNEANITVFVHGRNANTKVANSLKAPFSNIYKNKDKYGYQDFYSWSVQLSGHNSNFSSQIYAVYKSKSALGITPEWTYSFENKAITRPYLFNHSDTSQFILIQELDHTIHAITPSGQKLWSTVFAGRTIGDIQQLEDRSLLLVTDRNRLYRFDTNGNMVKGFSIGIPQEPTSSPIVSKINNQESILIPTSDKIYAYNMNGQEIKDWKKADFDGEITTSLLNSEDNSIFFGTSHGYIIQLNTTGDIIKKINLSGAGPIKAIYYNNAQNLYAVDSRSNIHIVNKDNENSKKIEIDTTSNGFYTYFALLTSSSQPNLSYLNKGTLQVYNIGDSLNLQYEHHFTKNIENRPQLFDFNNSKQKLIGVASKATNLVYVFEENGQVKTGFPVEGLPLFYYGKINYNSDSYLLCMRRDHKLYAFRHQK